MGLSCKKLVEDLAREKAPGPSATFTAFHIFYALELMAKKPIGRNKLARKLGVGGGAVRTIISRLKEAGLITTSKSGCRLTDEGLAVWKQLDALFPTRVEIEKNELATSDFNYAFLVRNSGHKVKSGIEQRDAAIVAGAKRAIAIVDKAGKLSIEPVSQNIQRDFPKAASQILQKIKPVNNDVVIIAGADTPLKAMNGAFAASWTLLNDEASC